ncbi:homeobox protein cut-like 1 isoform X1 [Anneissia japonica]|uniref:homeobox protein cut-like 1 isoform X1 n=1 Tax=Anneissia japonica TaxID=1529436 RepID=UPI00142569EA|nr:homeobox protein cut-like 1 isoform X1 [Anneissia japonica]
MAAANITSMFQYWKNFNLQELQKELDSTATELANRQDESDSSRKRLVEQSREFKKNTSEEVRKSVAQLLKSFQGEVDALSKRSKAAEGAFLSVYKKLIDVPDPVTVLEQTLAYQKKLQKAQDLEIENQKLRETLEEYNHEFAEVKNQEVTIKNLKEKLKEYEGKIEATAQARAKEKEKELQREFADKERQLQETQMTVAVKLGEAEVKVSTLQAALDNALSELFDVKSKFDEKTAAKSDEMEIVMTDLERSNQKVAETEKEIESLKRQLMSANQSLQLADQMQKAPNVEQAIDVLTRSSLEIELAAKEKEISQLVEDVQRLQATNAKLRDTSSSQLSKLEEQLSARDTAFRKLEEKLQSQNDYDETKRELNVIKATEFNSSNGVDQEGTSNKTLEMLLLEKNRALQSENTTLKVANQEINGNGGFAHAQAFASMVGHQVAAAYNQKGMTSPQNSQIIQPIIVIPPTFNALTPTTQASHHFHPALNPQRPLLPNNIPAVRPMFKSSPNSRDSSSQRSTPNESQASPSSTIALNHDPIDTIEIARKVKDFLLRNGIGQRVFGEYFLGLSQGSVSDILSRPKPWDKLTLKGREPYIKMLHFLTDPQGKTKLKMINAHRKGREASPQYLPPTQLPTYSSGSTEEAVSNILALARQEIDAQKSHEMSIKSEVANGAHCSQASVRAREALLQCAELAHQQITETPVRSQSNDPSTSPRHSISGDCEGESSSGDDSRGLMRVWRRHMLQPLTTEQFRQSQNLNTVDLCQEVKDILFKSGISQKVFGELVLGLSQGSVSDLLSRPKEWGRLTPRGREPYIRMKLWLAEENNIQKLKEDSAKTGIDGNMDEESQISSPTHCGTLRQQTPPMPVTPPLNPPPSDSPIDLQTNQSQPSTPNPQTESELYDMFSPEPLPDLPPVRDKAATIEYLDTYELARQVKTVLGMHNVGQRAFGEAVLGLTQGSVSDLLSKPKMWLKLSMKGREPYIRMHMWLNDPNGTEMVKNYKPKRRPKRMLMMPNSNSPLSKRPRVLLSPEEKATLLEVYLQDPYPSSEAMNRIAQSTNLSVSTVTNWFHNHRSRLKRGSAIEDAEVGSYMDAFVRSGGYLDGSTSRNGSIADDEVSIPDSPLPTMVGKNQHNQLVVYPMDSNEKALAVDNMNSRHQTLGTTSNSAQDIDDEPKDFSMSTIEKLKIKQEKADNSATSATESTTKPTDIDTQEKEELVQDEWEF